MGTARFGVSMPEDLMRAFDRQIEGKGYGTRSEALRDIIRGYLVEAQWETSAAPVVGTVTVVYDHETRELTQALTDLQHHCHGEIVCSTHIHLDSHNCLEVIVLKGTVAQVQAVADRIIATRGVKHGKLVCTTTGRGLL